MFHHRVCAGLFVLVLGLPSATIAQDFDSGSTGADGALTFAANAGTIDFDPTTYTPRLDPEVDNVYHFTSITIPAGTTVRLSARTLPEGRPVHWLASGAVTIAGTLDLAGENGHNFNATVRPSIPGAGGYSGGIATQAPTRGNGPGGGDAALSSHGGPAGHRFNGQSGEGLGGSAYGNDFLLPLLGGSGGGGGWGTFSGGAGAGGGAIVVASSTSIRVLGQILAAGGSAGAGRTFQDRVSGAGSGGAIRLIAPRIEGTGTLNVAGGSGNGAASHGRIRLEAFRNTSTFSIVPPTGLVTPAAPGAVFLPPSAPAIKVVRVAGQAVAMSPTGSFDTPDVVVDSATAVTVEIEARHVPLGTVLNLTFQPETGAPFTATATPLAGTVEQSTATAQVVFPHGPTRMFVKATWNP
jgi:hypothetical protein